MRNFDSGCKSNFKRASSIRSSLHSSVIKHTRPRTKIGSGRQIPEGLMIEQVSRRVSKWNQPEKIVYSFQEQRSIYALKCFAAIHRLFAQIFLSRKNLLIPLKSIPFSLFSRIPSTRLIS